MAAGAEADVDAALGLEGFGDSAGVAGPVAPVETDGGNGVEDATGVGKDEAAGATEFACGAGGLGSGAWPKAASVKKLSALRIKKTLFIYSYLVGMD